MKAFIILLQLLSLSLYGGEAVFQNGLNGYQGTADGAVVGSSERAMTTSYWGRDTLNVSGTSRGGSRSLVLIRFDNIFGDESQQLPAGAKITQARLELYKVGEPKDNGQYNSTPAHARVIACHRMLTPYAVGRPDRESDAYACFSYRSYHEGEGDFWGEHHRLEDGPVKGVDFTDRPIATAPLQVGEIGGLAVLDVTEAVKHWAEGGENHGFLLTARGFWIGASYASSQHSDPTWRPRLIVEYQP